MAQPTYRTNAGAKSAGGLRNSWRFRIGIALLILGSGPLAGFVVAEALGLIADPNPNPIGLGLLFFLTFPIAAILIVSAVSRTSSARQRAIESQDSSHQRFPK